MNQCDGCQRRLPRTEEGIHYGEHPLDLIYCTADRYMPADTDFHKHLDRCDQCRTQPFNLCPTGARLLRATAT